MAKLSAKDFEKLGAAQQKKHLQDIKKDYQDEILVIDSLISKIDS